MADGGGQRRRRRRPGDDLRTESRERALTILYEAQSKRLEPSEVVASLPIRPDDRVIELVSGVQDRAALIDEAIRSHARNWDLARMPVIDLAVLRIATHELMCEPDTPTAVIIDEAVELAKRFSTDDSGRFVNGVLAAVAQQVRGGSAPTAGGTEAHDATE